MADPNLYSPPEATLARPVGLSPGTGDFDIGTAVSEAWAATISNFWLMLGGMIVIGVLSSLSALTVIGYFLLMPTFFWGAIKLWLNAFDGRGRIGDCFSGFSQYWQATGCMLGMIAIVFVASLAVNSVAYVGIFTESAVTQVVGNVIGFVITFTLFPRVYFSYFYVVEQGMGPLQAIAAAWNVTTGKTLKMILLLLISVLIAIAGVLALGVGLLFAIPMIYFLFVSAYRQVVGRPVTADA